MRLAVNSKKVLLCSQWTCGNGGNSRGLGGVVQGAGGVAWGQVGVGVGVGDLAGVMQLLNIPKECQQTLLIQLKVVIQDCIQM